MGGFVEHLQETGPKLRQDFACGRQTPTTQSPYLQSTGFDPPDALSSQIRVEGLSLLLAGRKDLVACCSKSSNNDEVTTFIGQEPHLSSFGTQAVDAFVSDGISGVC